MSINILLLEIKNRNHESFKRLFYLYYDQLVNHANKYLFDRSQSEDVVQEVFIHFWENSADIDIQISLKAYLYQMVRNKSLNYLKSLKITDDIGMIDLASDVSDKQTNVTVNYQYKEVLKVVDTMPIKMQKVFRMKYIGNYAYREIAQELNVSINTVKTQLKRAKQRLIASNLS